MKILVIDIETTALHPNNGVILSLGASYMDTEKPITESQRFIYHYKHTVIHGEAIALAMNMDLITSISNEEAPEYTFEHTFNRGNKADMHSVFADFLHHKCNIRARETVNLGGKNLGTFDLDWIDPHGSRTIVPGIDYHRRLLDPAPFYYMKQDKVLPDMRTCMSRSKTIGNEALKLGITSWNKHDALHDCIQCEILLREVMS